MTPGQGFKTIEWNCQKKTEWSAAHGKRIASKARNIKCHKRYPRGKL